MDVDGAYLKPYTDDKGDEAHNLLQKFYLWYVSLYTPIDITGGKEFRIKNGSLDPNAEYGRCDLILWNKPYYTYGF